MIPDASWPAGTAVFSTRCPRPSGIISRGARLGSCARLPCSPRACTRAKRSRPPSLTTSRTTWQTSDKNATMRQVQGARLRGRLRLHGHGHVRSHQHLGGCRAPQDFPSILYRVVQPRWLHGVKYKNRYHSPKIDDFGCRSPGPLALLYPATILYGTKVLSHQCRVQC